MTAADLAEAMKAAGCSLEQIIAALRDLEEKKLAKSREGNRLRQARHRERNANNAGNAGNADNVNNADNGVTGVTSVTKAENEPESPRAPALVVSLNNIIPPIPSGLVPPNSKSKPSRRARPRGEIDPDAQPSVRNRDYAASVGMTGLEFDDEWGGFRSHHRAKGSVMRDWDAAWETWARNWRKYRRTAGPRLAYAQPQGPPAEPHRNPPPMTREQALEVHRRMAEMQKAQQS